MALNVGAPLRLMGLVLPEMRDRRRGCIINISSVAAGAVTPFNSAYEVSKSALNNLSGHVAAESAETGVDIFAVHPGAAFTELMQASLRSEGMARWLPKVADFCQTLEGDADAAGALSRCADHCVRLAAGTSGQRSGSFLDLSGPDMASAAKS